MSSKTSRVGSGVLNLSFTSNFTFNTTKYYFSTLLPVTLRSCITMGRMGKEQSVCEQFTLRDFKKGSSTALKTFIYDTIIITNNSDKIKISWASWICFCLCCLFWVNSTGCSGEFHVAFKRFQILEILILNFWNKKCIFHVL